MDLQPAKTPTGNTRWLLSFIDLFSVFLAFFVLLFAMQSIDKGKWQQFSGAMRGSFQPTESQKVILPDSKPDATFQPKPLLDGLRYLAGVITQQTGGQWQGQVLDGALIFPLPPTTTQGQFLSLMKAIGRLSNPAVLTASPQQLSTAWQWLILAKTQAGTQLTGVQLTSSPAPIQLRILPPTP